MLSKSRPSIPTGNSRDRWCRVAGRLAFLIRELLRDVRELAAALAVPIVDLAILLVRVINWLLGMSR